MFKKIRLETSTSLNFGSADKCGFSLRSAADDKRGDWSINKVMDKLLVNANSDKQTVRAIPADKANVADLEGVVYQILGMPNTPETIAALEAGKPVYHVMRTYTRIFEYVPGRVNTGGAEASIAGLDDVTDFTTDNPLV